MMPWVKPRAHNDWGATVASPLLEDGPQEVRWPDGTIETIEVEHRLQRSSVNDMGHAHTTESRVPYFWITHNGSRLPVALVDSGVLVKTGKRVKP